MQLDEAAKRRFAERTAKRRERRRDLCGKGICPKCEGRVRLQESRSGGGKRFRFTHYWHCQDCGTQFYDPQFREEKDRFRHYIPLFPLPEK